MNSSLWLENILNLATFLTSAVSLLTLNELRKQRYLANSPKLHITSKNDFIEAKNIFISEIGKSVPIVGKANSLKEMKPDFPSLYSIPLNLINIGSTPALNVKITWSYDKEGRHKIKNIFNEFNELNLGLSCKIPDKIYSHSFEVGNILEISGKKLNKFFLMGLMPFKTDSVFPISESNQGTNFFIPHQHAIIISFELSTLSISKKLYDFSVPTLYANVSYYDNINVLHKETFSIKTRYYGPVMKTINGDLCEEDSERVVLSIEIYKINKSVYLNKMTTIIEKSKLIFKGHIRNSKFNFNNK